MPQLSSAELLAIAELAGFARVVVVKHTPDGRIARLHFERVVKGRYQGTFVARQWSRLSGAVTVKLHKRHCAPDGAPSQGEWSDRVDPGERIMVHLRWDPDAGAYSTVAPNAIWQASG